MTNQYRWYLPISVSGDQEKSLDMLIFKLKPKGGINPTKMGENFTKYREWHVQSAQSRKRTTSLGISQVTSHD